MVFIPINSTRQGIRTLVMFNVSCNIDNHYFVKFFILIPCRYIIELLGDGFCPSVHPPSLLLFKFSGHMIGLSYAS